MPWANDPESRRRSQATYGDPEYQRNRATCLRQANGRCQRCGRHAKLTCDHIIPRSQGGSHALANLQALCKTCHGRKTGEQHGWKARGQAVTDPEPEPRTRW